MASRKSLSVLWIITLLKYQQYNLARKAILFIMYVLRNIMFTHEKEFQIYDIPKCAVGEMFSGVRKFVG